MATFSRKWITVVILTALAKIFSAQPHTQDDCVNGQLQVIKDTDLGSIYSNSAKLQNANECKMWRIEATNGGSVNIRLSLADFNQTLCDAGSSLELGPAPFYDICQQSGYHLPIMYHSMRPYVWIKYTTGSQLWTSSVDQFRLDYIGSESPLCKFKCEDKTCIHQDWVCNGMNECESGEDETEMLCKLYTTVSEQQDEPPHAVVSSNVILHLPENSVVLYGNASYDDHGIISYRWLDRGTHSLSYNAQGLLSPILHLSGLEAGVYVFTLYVTDVKGQTSTADVHIVVKPDIYQLDPNFVKTSPKMKPFTKTSTSSTCFKCFQPILDQIDCLPTQQLCDGISQCRFGEDELTVNCRNTPISTTSSPTNTCAYNAMYCYVITHRQYMCLHNMYTCDGSVDCANGEDEDPTMCGDRICNKRLEAPVGWFASPRFPQAYKPNEHCSWVIHQRGTSSKSIIQLRVVAFSIEDNPGTDYVNIYDGPDDTYDLIGSYYGAKRPPRIIESSSYWMNIVFKSSDYVHENQGFNFTYQIKGVCLPTQQQCAGENDCYDVLERCNGVWDCPLKGSDEIGCGHCSKGDYSCGSQTNQCYHSSERCNGLARCSNAFDETNCSPEQCGTHNGTFLCNNNRCIYESWTCDQRDDCGDNSDEDFCSGTTKRVIIAAICGSMICALLLVILLGCSCKLYSVRNLDHNHRHIRHDSPMSRMYAEFLRRRAPPPYHEAMLTSRNFDEVQQEYLERMRNSRQNRRNRRRTRNQQNQASTDNTASSETQPGTNVENTGAADESTNGMQLSTINEETETHGVSSERDSSTAELLPSASDSDSSDDHESETDLAEQGQGHSVSNGDNDDDDDNILASPGLSAQWTRAIDSEDSSDDACILDDSSISPAPNESQSEGHCDNGSIDTEVSASISSMDHHEIPTNSNMFKDTDSESSGNEEIENSHNSTPKPDCCHGNTVISETGMNRLRARSSNGSLDSIESDS